MSYSGQTSPSSGNTSSSNSASHYAAAALGMGLVALGIVMVVWSVVPAGSGGNSSQPGRDTSSTSKAAFVMVGLGIVMLILALCLRVCNKRRAARQPQTNGATTTVQNRDVQSQSEQTEHYAVPSYEEVVGNEQYPISQFTSRKDSTTHLPAYEELIERGQGGAEGSEGAEGSDAAAAQSPQTQSVEDDSNPAPTQPSGDGRRSGRAGLKLIPLKVRRIKSEKLGRKTSSPSPPAAVSNIEPLTPPPQYDDMPPELQHAPE